MEHEPIIQFEKANLIRSNNANCMRCSKCCEGFKINSKSISELSSLYETQEITINNPLEIGKSFTAEGQDKVYSTSRHSSSNSVNRYYNKDLISPMFGEVFKDTTSFLAYLDKKKVVFSEQKVKRNQTKLENEINKENNSIIIIEDKEPKEKTSVSRRRALYL